MNIQCPACLENNPNGSTHCQVCGYSLTESKLNHEVNNNNNYSPHHLAPKTLLSKGHYQIEKTLGEGGFGITYKGKYLGNQAIVAIKELWPEKSARNNNEVIWSFKINPKEKQWQINKFKLEAQNQRKCVHPNIPQIYACFEENNTVYIVMEFIDGKSLLKILQETGVLTEEKIKKYFIQITEALKVVHKNNFLHRDIKPENIIINPQDNAILIDFGATKEFIDGMTSSMSTVLTPGYAPYEQYSYNSKRYAATDFYALCASMYELLTGKLPLDAAERVDSLLHNQGKDPLIPPRQFRSEISSLMENIILTGMKIKVEERFQTADELIKALQAKQFISPLHKKAQDLLKQNNLIDSINAYKKCLKNEANNIQALTELALLQTHVNLEEAEITANQALQLNSTDGRIYGILGLVACRQKNWDKAVSDLQTAAKLSPQEAWIQANLAWALAKTEKWEAAQITINQALSLDANSTFALGIKAWILVQKQQWKQAIPPATQAIFKAKQSNNRNSQQLQQWLYPYLIIALKHAVISKNPLDIERKINDYYQTMPDSAYACGLKGWQLAHHGSWEKALTFFQKATSTSIVPSWVLINQGIVYENLNQTEEALQTYLQYQQLFGDNGLVYYRSGTLLGKQKQWQKAKIYLEKAINLKLNLPEMFHNLGWVLLNEKKLNQEDISYNIIISAYAQAINLYLKNNSNYGLKLKQLFDTLQIPL